MQRIGDEPVHSGVDQHRDIRISVQPLFQQHQSRQKLHDAVKKVAPDGQGQVSSIWEFVYMHNVYLGAPLTQSSERLLPAYRDVVLKMEFPQNC